MKRKPPLLDKPYPKHRPLLESEIELWRAVIEDKGDPKVKTTSKETKPHSAIAKVVPKKKKPPLKAEIHPLDANTHTRISRGKLSIQATLDLHGHTQATAYAMLIQFLARAQVNGWHTVLIITGKGEGGEGKTLRELLPRWLRESPLRNYIKAYDSADARHGGSGAWYVRIRKA